MNGRRKSLCNYANQLIRFHKFDVVALLSAGMVIVKVQRSIVS